MGILNTWHPMVVALLPSTIMLVFASIAMWVVERR